MPDWDGNGKQDWHDDYVFHEVFNTQKQSNSNNQHTSGSSGMGRTIAIILAVVFFWELLNAIASALY